MVEGLPIECDTILSVTGHETIQLFVARMNMCYTVTLVYFLSTLTHETFVIMFNNGCVLLNNYFRFSCMVLSAETIISVANISSCLQHFGESE